MLGRGSGGSLLFHHLRLDGSTPSTARAAMIAAFNHPNSRFNVFLLSTNAGGEGINLTAASRVVLLDVSWNPSRDQVDMSDSHVSYL